jgi:hypothetical protein
VEQGAPAHVYVHGPGTIQGFGASPPADPVVGALPEASTATLPLQPVTAPAHAAKKKRMTAKARWRVMSLRPGQNQATGLHRGFSLCPQPLCHLAPGITNAIPLGRSHPKHDVQRRKAVP